MSDKTQHLYQAQSTEQPVGNLPSVQGEATKADSRIPPLKSVSREDVKQWFVSMAERGLLFHPEDSPSTIIRCISGEPLFTAPECAELEIIMGQIFSDCGNDVCLMAMEALFTEEFETPSGARIPS